MVAGYPDKTCPVSRRGKERLMKTNTNPIKVIFVRDNPEVEFKDEYFYVSVEVTEYLGEKFLEGKTLYKFFYESSAYKFSEKYQIPIAHMSEYLRAREVFDEINDDMPFIEELRRYVEHNGGLIVEPRSRRAIRF